MSVKKSPARPERNYRDAAPAGRAPTSTDRYVEHLLERMGSYAKPAAEARRIVDRVATSSLTDALYESRRDGQPPVK